MRISGFGRNERRAMVDSLSSAAAKPERSICGCGPPPSGRRGCRSERSVAARISPDGRWIAYGSFQSGRREVFVRAFPGPSWTCQISIDGGNTPVWAPDGRALFYRWDNSMMAARRARRCTAEAIMDWAACLIRGYFVGTRCFRDLVAAECCAWPAKRISRNEPQAIPRHIVFPSPRPEDGRRRIGNSTGSPNVKVGQGRPL